MPRTSIISRGGRLSAVWILLSLLYVNHGLAQAEKSVPQNALPENRSDKAEDVSHMVGKDNGAHGMSPLIVTKDYIIGPEDILEISVWRNTDLSKQVHVRPDGRISLPLIGDVVAVGKTPEQLTDDIAARLKEFMENPTVAIVVTQVNSYMVFVIGEVKAPGKYPLKIKTSLLQLLTMAGGFTQTAARNKIVVFRFGDNGNQQKIKASYDDIVLRDDPGQNVVLKPGDTIVVPSQSMVLIP